MQCGLGDDPFRSGGLFPLVAMADEMPTSSSEVQPGAKATEIDGELELRHIRSFFI